MCIRDSSVPAVRVTVGRAGTGPDDSTIEEGDFVSLTFNTCLLYTSDAADDLLCVDLGGRRIIKKKKISHTTHDRHAPNLQSMTKYNHQLTQ